ncbi:mechanosensitive ion channel [Polyangium aurulentum]|uniref:mechanosensitive ion channel n=1 Tax=Polyangium aurulentum TaxID=2567896 RepID=UPI0010AE6A2E|nr:mechanosensitive ion channel [Polyangium aurulentum]UQA63027.1 mechanosensitive ion channel [Polyangium aurulentum]
MHLLRLGAIAVALIALTLPPRALAAQDAAAQDAATQDAATQDAAAPEPSAAPSAAAVPPAPTAAPAALLPEAVPVRLRKELIFELRVPRHGASASERARAAGVALRAAAESGTDAAVRTERRGDAIVILAGERAVFELGPEDAAAAGEPSVDALGNQVAQRVRETLKKEQTRSAALVTLLSAALVVLSGIIALFFARKIGQLADRMRGFLEEHPERIPAIRLQSIEVIRPESLRAALLIGTAAARVLLRLGIVYGWVLISLSLFEPTRAYAERLSGFVFGPLYSLITRLIGSLPLLVVAAIAAVALIVLVRFIGLFFEGVARGQTTLDWLPADLAAPTSILVRAAVVLGFFVIAAPLVTGDDDGALVRAVTVVVAALGLATTPLLASAAVGVAVVYGRRISVGDFAEIGGRAGRVRAVSLLEVELEGEEGTTRVPHLYTLVQPTRLLGPEPPVCVDVALGAAAIGQDDVRELLLESAATVGKGARVEVLQIDAEGIHYRVTIRSAALGARGELLSVVAQALAAAEVPLGRARAATPA